MMPQTVNSPIHLVQITDTHLYGKATGTLLKMNTHDSFEHVIELVRGKEDRIDLILATGDIAQDASESAYSHFAERIGALEAPYRWIPGNHDKAEVMKNAAASPDVNEKSVQINNWLILMLDTSTDGQVHGNLAPGELEFLHSQLQESELNNSTEHIMICMHHNPVKGNSGWMKDIGLKNRARFWELAKTATKIKCVVYGHIHQELDFVHENIRCLCSPSTCIQFKPNVVNFALDQVNPGYRSFELHANGTVESEVHRVEGENFEADFSSGGY